MDESIAAEIKQNIHWLHERSQKTKSELETHEAVCAERYKNITDNLLRLSESIEATNSQVKELHQLATASRVSFKTILFVGAVVAGITGFIYTMMNIFNLYG